MMPYFIQYIGDAFWWHIYFSVSCCCCIWPLPTSSNACNSASSNVFDDLPRYKRFGEHTHSSSFSRLTFFLWKNKREWEEECWCYRRCHLSRIDCSVFTSAFACVYLCNTRILIEIDSVHLNITQSSLL